MRVYTIAHVQLAIPPNSEDLARTFYGEILGLREKPKPEHLASKDFSSMFVIYVLLLNCVVIRCLLLGA